MKKEIKRYQECNFIVRLYRRLRWQPFYFIKAVFAFLQVVFSKGISEDAIIVYKLTYGEWNSKANWWYTPEEVFRHLREMIDKKKR